jgi:hypothetical protein
MCDDQVISPTEMQHSLLPNAKCKYLHKNNLEYLSSNCSGCSEGTPSVAEVLEVFDPEADPADVVGNWLEKRSTFWVCAHFHF